MWSSASRHGRGGEETDEPSARPHTSVSPSPPKKLEHRKHFPIPSVHGKIHPSEQQEPRARVTSHRGRVLPGRKYSLSGQGVGQNIIRDFLFRL